MTTLNLSLKDSLSNISFCDKQCSNLNNNKAKEELINFVQNKFKIEIIKKSYVVLNPHMMRNISYHQHILSTLTNGNIYLLFLTKIDGINCCFFIDRKLKNGYSYPKIHCVKYRFDDSLYENGTILNGELIRDQNRDWFFIISDILIYKGKSMKDKNILSRFNLLHSILKNEYKQDLDLEICPLQIKKLFLYKDLNVLINDFIPSLSYVCKGLVFNTLSSNFSDYAYIMPRDKQIQIKKKEEIDEMIKEHHPDLLNRQISSLSKALNDTQLQNISDDNSDISNGDNETNELKLKYNTVIFDNTNTNKIGNGINNNDNKNKIGKDNVIFRILKTEIPDIYHLYSMDGQNLSKYSNALIPNIEISLMLYNLFNSNKKIDFNMECKFSNHFERWIPLRQVSNKPYQKSTVENIQSKLITSM